MKFLKIKMIAVVSTLIFLSACQTEAQNNLKQVEIMLDWYPNAVHTFLYVALEEGYFEEEGLDVDIVFPANPSDPIQLAGSGAIEFAISYQNNIILAQEEDLPVSVVAPIVRSPLNHLLFLSSQDFDSPADLEGHTVGYSGIALNELYLKTMVELDGGDFSKVNVIDVGFELGPAIMSERTDAIIGAYINHEYPVLQHKGFDIDYLNPADYGVPSYYELVLIANSSFLSENEDIVNAFWSAAEKGYSDMKEDPYGSLDILLQNQDEGNFPLIESVERESLDILLEKMESPNEPFGSFDQAHWDDGKQWLLSNYEQN
ncbi:ABC transporter substrate-binding protein [Bacillus sp. TS-2]|nr:ABC transporter substrate-binding protein [Bacillus sp. TS-2]